MDHANRLTDLQVFYTFSVIFVVFVICIFLAWHFYSKAKHKERLLLIEKGIDPAQPDAENHFPSLLLKFGIVIIGFSIGFALVGIFNVNEMVNLALLGVCGGLSFIVANYVSNSPGKSDG